MPAPDTTRASPRPHRPRLSPQRLVGSAGEHLVVADLLLQGHAAFLAPDGYPYDVLVDFGGKWLRVQVKTTAEPKPGAGRWGGWYCFSAKRVVAGPYDVNEIDLFALVALDVRRIAYMTSIEAGQTIMLRDPRMQYRTRGGKTFDGLPFADAIAALASPRDMTYRVPRVWVSRACRRCSKIKTPEEFAMKHPRLELRDTTCRDCRNSARRDVSAARRARGVPA